MSSEHKPQGPPLVHMPGTLGFSAIYPDSIKMVSDCLHSRYKTDELQCFDRQAIGQMMVDMYRSMNINFMPTANDIDQFARLLDIDKSGQINDKNLNRLARKHVAISKYDIDKKYLRGETSSYQSISSVSSQQQVETISPLSQTQSITLQPLQPAKNFSNTANMGAYFNKTTAKTSTVLRTEDCSKENLDPQLATSDKHKIKEEILVAFSEFDFDRDGKINSFECQRSLMRFGWKLGVNPTKVNLDSLFSKADLDGDGLISLQEFSTTILQIN